VILTYRFITNNTWFKVYTRFINPCTWGNLDRQMMLLKLRTAIGGWGKPDLNTSYVFNDVRLQTVAMRRPKLQRERVVIIYRLSSCNISTKFNYLSYIYVNIISRLNIPRIYYLCDLYCEKASLIEQILLNV